MAHDLDGLRDRIAARLDGYDVDHGTLGCHWQAGQCIHSAVAGLRAALDVADFPDMPGIYASVIVLKVAEAMGIDPAGAVRHG